MKDCAASDVCVRAVREVHAPHTPCCDGVEFTPSRGCDACRTVQCPVCKREWMCCDTDTGGLEFHRINGDGRNIQNFPTFN